jgi:hypothetical protein
MKLKKTLGLIIFCITAAVIFFSAFYLFLDIKWNRELHITIQDLKKNGKFPSKQELVPKKISSEINASHEFEKIFKIMTSGENAKEFTWKGGQKYSKLINSLLSMKYPIDSKLWSEANNNELVKNLNSAEVQEIINYLQKAETKQHLNFYLDYEAGPEMLLPHLDVIRKLYKIICLEAVYLAHTHRLDNAYRLLLSGLKTSLLLQQEPIIISQLIRIACTVNLMNTYKMLVYQYGISSKTAELFLINLPKHNTIEPFLKVADTEMIYMGMYIYDGILYGDSRMSFKQISNLLNNPIPLDYLPTFFIKPFIKKDYSEYLKQMADFKVFLKTPYWKLSNERLNRLSNSTESPPDYGFISKMIMPSLIKLLNKITQYKTEVDDTVLFTALQLYKNKYGKLPETLSDVVHDYNIKKPINHFTGEVLRITQRYKSSNKKQ